MLHFPNLSCLESDQYQYYIDKYLKNELNVYSSIDKKDFEKMEFTIKQYQRNRLNSRHIIVKYLLSNDIVLCDRYIYSTLQYQLGKIIQLFFYNTEKNLIGTPIFFKRYNEMIDKYINNIFFEEFRYINKYFKTYNKYLINQNSGMPIPDSVVYLDGDVKFIGEYRKINNIDNDIQESDIDLQNLVRYIYLSMFLDSKTDNCNLVGYNFLQPFINIRDKYKKLFKDIIIISCTKHSNLKFKFRDTLDINREIINTLKI